MASTYSFRYSRKRGTDDRLSEDEGEVSEKKKIRKQGDHVADAADDDNTTHQETQQVETNLQFSISFGARRVDKAEYPFDKEIFECTAQVKVYIII